MHEKTVRVGRWANGSGICFAPTVDALKSPAQVMNMPTTTLVCTPAPKWLCGRSIGPLLQGCSRVNDLLSASPSWTVELEERATVTSAESITSHLASQIKTLYHLNRLCSHDKYLPSLCLDQGLNHTSNRGETIPVSSQASVLIDSLLSRVQVSIRQSWELEGSTFRYDYVYTTAETREGKCMYQGLNRIPCGASALQGTLPETCAPGYTQRFPGPPWNAGRRRISPVTLETSTVSMACTRG